MKKVSNYKTAKGHDALFEIETFDLDENATKEDLDEFGEGQFHTVDEKLDALWEWTSTVIELVGEKYNIPKGTLISRENAADYGPLF